MLCNLYSHAVMISIYNFRFYYIRDHVNNIYHIYIIMSVAYRAYCILYLRHLCKEYNN